MDGSKIEEVDISRIVTDPRLQFRVGGTSKELAQEYAEEIKAGTWDAIKGAAHVFRDADCDPDTGPLLLADGHHDFKGHLLADRKTMLVVIHEGNFGVAFEFALGANGTHGKRRTRDDLKNAAKAALEHSDYGKLSTRQRAKLLKCDDSELSKIERELTGRDADPVKSAAASAGHEARRQRAGISAQQPAPMKTRSAPAPTTTPDEQIDVMGRLIPKHPQDPAAGSPLLEDKAKAIRQMAKEVESITAWNPHVKTSIRGVLDKAANDIEGARYCTSCPDCSGKGCPRCLASGFLPEWERHNLERESLPDAQELSDGEAAAAKMLRDVAAHVGRIEGLCREIDGIVAEAETLGKSPYGWSLMLNGILTQLRSARSSLFAGRLSEVCPYCEGKESPCQGKDGCRGIRRLRAGDAKRGRDAKQIRGEAA